MYFDFVMGIEKIPPDMKIMCREAVRCIVVKGDTILMIKTNKGDYKLPGGGVKSDEEHLDSLKREVLEETGYRISNDVTMIGIVTEQKPDSFESDAYFVMKSYYYLCSITGEIESQNLDDYEQELNFKPEFVSIQKAYEKNCKILKEASSDSNSWLEREIMVLRKIMDWMV